MKANAAPTTSLFSLNNLSSSSQPTFGIPESVPDFLTDFVNDLRAQHCPETDLSVPSRCTDKDRLEAFADRVDTGGVSVDDLFLRDKAKKEFDELVGRIGLRQDSCSSVLKFQCCGRQVDRGLVGLFYGATGSGKQMTLN